MLQSLFLASLVLGGAMLAAAGAGAQAVQWRKVGDTPGFPGLKVELQALVDAQPRSRVATFCVVLRDGGDKAPLVYALWPAKHLLYRWGPTREPQLSDATLLLHEPLDLRRDIVRTPSDRLSTYKVTRHWADDVAAQCRAHGEEVYMAKGGAAR